MQNLDDILWIAEKMRERSRCQFKNTFDFKEYHTF